MDTAMKLTKQGIRDLNSYGPRPKPEPAAQAAEGAGTAEAAPAGAGAAAPDGVAVEAAEAADRVVP